MAHGKRYRQQYDKVERDRAYPPAEAIGKDVTVAVFAQGQQARDAEAAGADFVGGQDLVDKVQEGWTDFDVAISTPEMMKGVGQLGRVLGPQGLMPNPKVGTVTDDVEKAVADSKSGKVEYRTDRQAIVHMAIGKASFDESKLLDNYEAVIDEIVRAKPSSAKGKYIVSATLATTMGPGIRVDSGKSADRETAAVGAGETAEEPATA
jgi:large subunit ribosomal protein L1